MSLLSRPLDTLIIVLHCYFIFSCVFIEFKYCADGLSVDDNRFMMPETYEFAKQYNPLFLQAPDWLRTATCMSAYGLLPGYVMMVFGFIFKSDWIRVPGLLLVGAKVQALVMYHLMEFTSDSPPPHLGPYWGVEAPYLLSLTLVVYRLSRPSPFTSTGQDKAKAL
ncbi:hypothetical protein CYMTET_53542 [Cymbomonas tetramitiformis]|uniref:EXPERA domain-containing protein n=1 Tax=Cymbomonas tetramitiformis TaxID=36881 RepID=A0AAE0BHW1_9CHLO|nr:hypothetical protein CYMTET_53542 [Cymbomonas tetramitiformis]